MTQSILFVAGACCGLFMLGYFLGCFFKTIEKLFQTDF